MTTATIATRSVADMVATLVAQVDDIPTRTVSDGRATVVAHDRRYRNVPSDVRVRAPKRATTAHCANRIAWSTGETRDSVLARHGITYSSRARREDAPTALRNEWLRVLGR